MNVVLPQPKPIDIARWQKEDRGKKIEKFVATAVKMRSTHPDDPERRLIHWRGGGSYKVGANYNSTSFDTRKLDLEDPVIEVQLISKQFHVSSHAPYYWESDLIKDFTTTDVYNLLVAKRFNRFFYNGNGSGCQTWTKALIQLLEDEGVLPAGSTVSFGEKVKEVHADPQFWVPDEPGARFY